MDKILDISFSDFFKQLIKNIKPAIALFIVLVAINTYFFIFKKSNDYKAAVDFYPLEEFAYSDLWLLQQEFLSANKGLVTFNSTYKPNDSPSLRYLPNFMHLNELVLFKFFKDYILSNKRRIVSEVSSNLNINDGFSVTFNDMSSHENRFLANNYVTLTFYNPELKPEDYPEIIEEFIKITRLSVNKVLHRQASKNTDFINFYIKNQENKLLVYVEELIDIFKNKIQAFEEAAIEARKLNISTSLLSNANYNVVNGRESMDQTASTTIYLQTYNIDVLPTISSGFEALESQANFFKGELSSVLQSLEKRKFNEIFTLHAQYAATLNIAESLSVSREATQRKNVLAVVSKRLEESSIHKGTSPIVDIKFENIYFYDSSNKLLIPMLSVFVFVIFFIFALFVNIIRSD